MKRNIILSLLIMITFSLSGYAVTNKSTNDIVSSNKSVLQIETKVTFIELGSVNCVPCKMMQPVMKQVEEKYRGQVKVVFYDVWTNIGRPFGQVYGIRVIPTQVFLDASGKEYFRHEGFFPYEELVKVLEQQGIK
ncbi:MAG: thioredoxin family protein [Candidatus Riflemargulisbacteria bacterium]